ncbi:MAG: PhzF family phenazine biosynthesis protein [Rudaea sp.]|nr:PhzF family phenazine biosynthesis protein [Rudaea sp.]
MPTPNPLRTSAFKQVDVFTTEPLLGNPLAVVLDADGLSGGDMQRIAAWTNLSETTFVLAPTQVGADYRVRIFTPRSELPFAGHPSVGTLHALLEAGRIEPRERMVQECAAGLLPMRIDGHGAERRIFVRAPRATMHADDAAVSAAATTALGAPAADTRLVDNGPRWLICDLQCEAAVRSIDPDMNTVAALCRKIPAVGVAVFGRATGTDYALAVRAFCPADGIPEDPVTGSANAAIGVYLQLTGQLGDIGTNYRVSQGREIGRDGFVDVCIDTSTGDVEIGGHSVTCVDGTLMLPHV